MTAAKTDFLDTVKGLEQRTKAAAMCNGTRRGKRASRAIAKLYDGFKTLASLLRLDTGEHPILGSEGPTDKSLKCIPIKQRFIVLK